MSIIREELIEFFPYKVLVIDRCEADDIIAVLTKRFASTHKTIAVTVDSDIHQLFKFDNFECFDPRKNSMVTMPDPANYLLVKVLSGDSGDNIKPLRPRLGPAAAQKIINNTCGDVAGFCAKEGLLESLQLNQRLINFEFIPSELEAEINHLYDSTIVQPVNGLHLPMYWGDAYRTVTRLMKKKLYNQ
jgi:5'-3' exonuclease